MFSYEEMNDEWSEYCVKNLLEIGIRWGCIVHINKPWDYSELSLNPNITWEIIKSNPDKPWNYSELSLNSNITWKIVQANPDKPWDYCELSSNPNITWEIIKSNHDKPWNYSCLSQNPNITFKYIKKNIGKNWNVYELSLNEFTLEKEMFFRKYLSEWFKKSNLKRELIENLWQPNNYEKFKYYDPEMFLEEEE